MDLKDLRFFIAVYESGGFHRASERLGAVQSTVSKRMIKLEHKLGGVLFERRWRKIVPTIKGDKLYLFAKSHLATLDRAEQALRT